MSNRWFRSKRINYHEHDARVDFVFARRSPIIHHYCPHTYNAGDHFVVQSIRNALRRHLPHALFVPKAIARNRGWGAPFRLAGPNIGFSNQNADAVVVGGSDNYRNWSLRIDGREIQKLRPPLFLVGMGVSSDDLDQPPLIEKRHYLNDIRKTHERAQAVLVRDQATLDFLRSLGVERALLTGCPALFLKDAEIFYHRPDGPILLTFPFPVNRNRLPQRFDAMRRLAGSLLARYGEERVVVVCHDDRDLLPAAETFPKARLFFSTDTHRVVDLYQSAALVVGSRLHGTILSASVGTPFVNINMDLRGQTFSQTFGLSDWNLDYTHPHLEDAVFTRTDRLLSGDFGALTLCMTRKLALRPVFDAAMAGIARTICKALPGGCVEFLA